jgi:hypothetical protein
MKDGAIIVNRDYQRSAQVWPPAAKSYLIDTILLGFPVPKLSLYQKIDLRSRQTIKEIVDGQQRSQAILDFFEDKFRIAVPGGTSAYSGKKYSELEEVDQIKFLEYQLTVDVFVGATDDEIRQVFKRINSYTIPLNHQEKRHATYQGEFKWFIASLSNRYAQALKDIGALTERRLIRMDDADLFTEIIHALYEGIMTKSEPKLDKFYEAYDVTFPEKDDISKKIDFAFNWILDWQEIHETQLVKAHNIYVLALAIIHSQSPVPALAPVYSFEGTIDLNRDTVLTNLTALASAVSETGPISKFQEFINASSKGGTDTKKHRETRFIWVCRALESSSL